MSFVKLKIDFFCFRWLVLRKSSFRCMKSFLPVESLVHDAGAPPCVCFDCLARWQIDSARYVRLFLLRIISIWNGDKQNSFFDDRMQRRRCVFCFAKMRRCISRLAWDWRKKLVRLKKGSRGSMKLVTELRCAHTSDARLHQWNFLRAERESC